MKRQLRGRTWLIAIVASTGIVLLLASKAGDFLIVDDPRPSDVILVLAGETENRPERALSLLRAGYSQKIVLDVPAGVKIYGFTQTDLAQRYVHDLPEAAQITICQIAGLSTKDESKEAEKCMAGTGARSVLIVTADFHTRRALEIFKRQVPEYEYSTAAATNRQHFGARWWTHREWAKTLLDEWMRLLWWKCVDRWR